MSRAATLRRLLLWYLRSANAAASQIDVQFRAPVWPSLEGEPAREFTNYDEAVRWYEDERGNLAAAVGVAAAEGFHEIAWQLPLVLRRIYASRAPVDEWISTGLTGLEAARENGTASAVADLLESLGMAYAQSHQTGTGRTYHREALEIRTADADVFGQGSSLNSLGLIDYREHRMRAACSNFERALELFRALGEERWEGIVLGNLADALLGRGDLEEAEQAAERAVVLHQRTGNRLSEFSVLVTLSWTAQARGRFADALAHLASAQELAEDLGNTVRVGYASLQLGRLHANNGELDDALAAYHHSVWAHQQVGDAVREAEALQGVAEVTERQNAE